MEWNALLNAVVRDRNVMGVKDPLMDLLAAMCMELVRLEAATAYARPQWETTGADATAPAETRPSSPATESTEALPSTNSTSPTTFFLVREGLTGSRRIMAMVTLVERNFTLTPGGVRSLLRDVNWSIHPLATWESPSPSGSTPSASQVAPEAGRSAGIAAVGDCPACRALHRLHKGGNE